MTSGASRSWSRWTMSRRRRSPRGARAASGRGLAAAPGWPSSGVAPYRQVLQPPCHGRPLGRRAPNSGVDIGLEDRRRDLPARLRLSLQAVLEIFKRCPELPEGLGALGIEREVGEVLHERGALDVEIEVRVHQTLVDIERLALPV